MIRAVIVCIALALSSGAAAHSFWLQPIAHRADAGEEVRVEFKIGDAGDVGDWGLYWERIASLRLISPDGVRDQQSAVRTTMPGERGAAQLTIEAEGTHILAFESNPSFSDLEADRFNRYLEHEGLLAIANHRARLGRGDENGTELYARRAKTLLQVGERLTANVTEPIGQTLEIVPLQNPFALEPGEGLDLQILWRGAPLPDATVMAARLDGAGEVEAAISDGEGKVRLHTAPGSAMLYSVVWGVPAPNDARADYFTIFASLTVGQQ